jgi:hypothetical protein
MPALQSVLMRLLNLLVASILIIRLHIALMRITAQFLQARQSRVLSTG